MEILQWIAAILALILFAKLMARDLIKGLIELIKLKP